MEFLPIFTRLKGREVTVVGGGDVALRKARLLKRAGAKITIVSPDVCSELSDIADVIKTESYDECLLGRPALVIAATDDNAVNQRVFDDAQAANIWVNVVDQPALCTFILPSIVDRSPLMIAVSSGGSSPVLARQIRSQIETAVPAASGALAELAAEFRGAVKAAIPDMDQRRDFWEFALGGPVAELVYAGQRAAAKEKFEELIADFNNPPRGEVYLVGAGPGDPDLLTFKALRLMQRADIVFYDRLVAPEIVNLTRQDAERVYVGKRRSEHAVPQSSINELLVQHAKAGKRVLRLKGGDPFIFGRGGEEIEQLAAEKIPFQVVPGITAASGCASYAGIPLTHRDYAQSVRFVTAHIKEGGVGLPWNELVHPFQTLVFYMGLVALPEVCAQLIAHGRSAETPMALIQQGTTANQKVLVGTLSTMPELVEREGVQAPTLIIVGEVVTLRDKLAWH